MLVGAEGIISTPEDILDVDVWNQLTLLRTLNLQIGYPDTVMVQALLSDFVAVPEPSSIVLAFVLLAIGLLYFFSKRFFKRHALAL